jgi:CDP-4-dehydro-6-deoxyglucose reductase, E3
VTETRVTVLNTGESYDCPAEARLLDAALAVGIRMPHYCRGGVCGTCKAQVVEGSVDHGLRPTIAITDEEKAAGLCLCCQARPRSPGLRLRMLHTMEPRAAAEDKSG